MTDRREPQIAAVLKRLEGFQHDHVIRAVGDRLRDALAGSTDTETITVVLPELNDAIVTLRGQPPTLIQRVKQAVAS